VGSVGTEKRQIANSCTGSPCIWTRTPLPIKTSVIAPTKPWSGLILRIISWRALTLRGGIETKPERNLGNPGVSFPPEKQKHTVRLPGRFHGKRNIYVGLFCWFLVHSGAPRKQSLKSPCFVSSNFSCFNFFPIWYTISFWQRCFWLLALPRGLCTSLQLFACTTVQQYKKNCTSMV
jgi:hypothetical protein